MSLIGAVLVSLIIPAHSIGNDNNHKLLNSLGLQKVSSTFLNEMMTLSFIYPCQGIVFFEWIRKNFQKNKSHLPWRQSWPPMAVSPYLSN